MHDQVPEGVVDLDRFPLHASDTPTYRELLAYCREELAEDGCCSVPGFLRPETLARIATEATALAPQAHRTSTWHNPYFAPDDSSLPDDHPRRSFQERTNGFVCTDLIPETSDLWTLYGWRAMTVFLEEAFGIAPLHRYADPLASMPFNVMRPGDRFPWHFDTNEFTVTLMIQAPEGGGLFEYAPDIRSTEDECYEAVTEVLAGDRTRVRTLELHPGDMQLFKGRFTLHRVTEVTGSRERYVAIPSWARQPGMVGSLSRTKEIYGRVLPIHQQQASVRADALVD